MNVQVKRILLFVAMSTIIIIAFLTFYSSDENDQSQKIQTKAEINKKNEQELNPFGN